MKLVLHGFDKDYNYIKKNIERIGYTILNAPTTDTDFLITKDSLCMLEVKSSKVKIAIQNKIRIIQLEDFFSLIRVSD